LEAKVTSQGINKDNICVHLLLEREEPEREKLMDLTIIALFTLAIVLVIIISKFWYWE